LYEYFDSKEAIIQALCTESHQRLRDQLLQVDPNLPPAKHLEALGLAYIRFALANPETYLLMFTNPPSPADLGPMLGESSSYPVLLDSIRRGLKRGDFKARAGYGLNEIAYSAWALVHGMAMLRLTYLVGFPLDLDAVDRETLHTFGRGLQLAGE
jgi:AcrR family transcriptional regulator